MEWNLELQKDYDVLRVCDNNDKNYPIYIQQESKTGEFNDIELSVKEAEMLISAIISIINLDKYRN